MTRRHKKVSVLVGKHAGQTIKVDSGASRETAVIAAVGTAGATVSATRTTAGVTVIPVAGLMGFSPGQTIEIDTGANHETAVVASTNYRGGAAITVTRRSPVPTRPESRSPAPVSPSQPHRRRRMPAGRRSSPRFLLPARPINILSRVIYSPDSVTRVYLGSDRCSKSSLATEMRFNLSSQPMIGRLN